MKKNKYRFPSYGGVGVVNSINIYSYNSSPSLSNTWDFYYLVTGASIHPCSPLEVSEINMSLLHDSLYFLLLSTLLFNSCQGILMVYQDPEMFTKRGTLCSPFTPGSCGPWTEWQECSSSFCSKERTQLCTNIEICNEGEGKRSIINPRFHIMIVFLSLNYCIVSMKTARRRES